MEWLSQNWVWVLFAVAMIVMHMGHGGHGGHSGHGAEERDAEQRSGHHH